MTAVGIKISKNKTCPWVFIGLGLSVGILIKDPTIVIYDSRVVILAI